MFVPIPVIEDPDTFPVGQLFHVKRDFGITAAIITAITISAAAAVTAAVAMASQVQTAEVVNSIVEQSARALQTQNQYNSHLEAGIRLLNQRVDILQEEIDALVTMVQVSCVKHTPGLCITPLQVNMTALKESQYNISEFLKGNWSLEGELLTKQLVFQIASLNATRLKPITMEDLTSWISSAFSWIKEWAGLLAIAALMCLAAFICLWCFCRIRRDHAAHRAVVYQALAAMDAQEDVSVWLASLKS